MYLFDLLNVINYYYTIKKKLVDRSNIPKHNLRTITLKFINLQYLIDCKYNYIKQINKTQKQNGGGGDYLIMKCFETIEKYRIYYVTLLIKGKGPTT